MTEPKYKIVDGYLVAEAEKELRDEFAMAALVIAWTWPQQDIAIRAYEIADAMMKARTKVDEVEK